MQELRRRLQGVVDTHYRGSARKASQACGFNDNYIGNLLGGASTVPSVESLATMARVFQWPLCDVVYWALGFEAPPPPTDPVDAIAQYLAAAGYPEGQRAFILQLVRLAARLPVQGPNNGSS